MESSVSCLADEQVTKTAAPKAQRQGDGRPGKAPAVEAKENPSSVTPRNPKPDEELELENKLRDNDVRLTIRAMMEGYQSSLTHTGYVQNASLERERAEILKRHAARIQRTEAKLRNSEQLSLRTNTTAAAGEGILPVYVPQRRALDFTGTMGPAGGCATGGSGVAPRSGLRHSTVPVDFVSRGSAAASGTSAASATLPGDMNEQRMREVLEAFRDENALFGNISSYNAENDVRISSAEVIARQELQSQLNKEKQRASGEFGDMDSSKHVLSLLNTGEAAEPAGRLRAAVPLESQYSMARRQIELAQMEAAEDDDAEDFAISCYSKDTDV